MQTMPDNDLDKLFRDAFTDAEIAPSKNLWSDIEQEIQPKKVKSFPIYWMVAALLLVTVSAGLLFNKQEKIQLRGNADVAENVKQLSVTTHDETYQKPIIQAVSQPALKAEKTKIQFAAVGVNKPIISSKNEIVETQNPTPIIAQTAAVKKNEVVSSEKFQENSETVIASLQNQAVTDNVINENEQAKPKSGIKNIGDLVNYVVGKVDKREDKLISFKNNSDDDGFTLASINIGPVKLNLHKHK